MDETMDQQIDSSLLSKLGMYHFNLLMLPYHQAKYPKKLSGRSVNVLLGFLGHKFW